MIEHFFVSSSWSGDNPDTEYDVYIHYINYNAFEARLSVKLCNSLESPLDTLPFGRTDAIEKVRLRSAPKDLRFRQNPLSLGRHVHGFATLPTFIAQADISRAFQRLQIATERGPIHGQPIGQLGNRAGLTDIDRRHDGKLRSIDARWSQRVIIGSRDKAGCGAQSSAGAGIDELK
nr:hypothetical protein [Sphingobium lactosutens]